MAKQSSIFLTYRFRTQITKFINSDGLSIKTICQAGTDLQGEPNDSLLYSIAVSSTDSIPNTLNLYLSDGITTYPWLTTSTLAATGTWSQLEVLNAQGLGVIVDSNGNYYVKLATGWSVLAGLASAVSGSNTTTIICRLDDF
jgi:hypothetical protein